MKVIWEPLPGRQWQKQIDWYREYKGEDFARQFSDSIKKTVGLIATMPDIGQKMPFENAKNIRSILVHPKCRLVYRYNKTTIRIVRLYFTMMQN